MIPYGTPVDHKTNQLDTLKNELERAKRAVEEEEARQKPIALKQAFTLLTAAGVTPKEARDYFQNILTPPKYKDIESNKTWNGRGPKPVWMKQDKSFYLIGD